MLKETRLNEQKMATSSQIQQPATDNFNNDKMGVAAVESPTPNNSESCDEESAEADNESSGSTVSVPKTGAEDILNPEKRYPESS